MAAIPARFIATSRRSFLLGAAALAVAPLPAWPRSPPLRPAFAPRPSDVCFSSRWARPESISTAQAFSANRLDWCYTVDPVFLRKARAAGLSVLGGALSPTQPDEVNGRERLRGRILDKTGNHVTAPWAPWSGIFWGCVNSPDFRASWLAHARAGLEAGFDWFIVDDPQINVSAVNWGGCYCLYCRAAAAREGLELERDMRKFQHRSVGRFHREMRAGINRLAGRSVSLAFNCPANTGSPRSVWYEDLFDFRFCEIDSAFDPADVAVRLTSAELAGRPQALTLRSKDVPLNRRLAAWAYANGGHMLAPWDVYIASTKEGSERFFGSPEDYAPIYRFARRLGTLLDRSAPAALPPPDAWAADRPGLRASLRADPDGSFAVLHLVSWDHDGPAELSIDPARVAGPKPVVEARARAPGGVELPFERRGNRLVCWAPETTWIAVEMRLAD